MLCQSERRFSGRVRYHAGSRGTHKPVQGAVPQHRKPSSMDLNEKWGSDGGNETALGIRLRCNARKRDRMNAQRAMNSELYLENQTIKRKLSGVQYSVAYDGYWNCVLMVY